MLPAAHRMRRSREFAHVIRRGTRAGAARLVLHVAPGDPDQPTRVGLVVGRQVGGSVTRHQVARKLRALAAEGLLTRGSGDLVVIRALPGAGQASSDELRADLAIACRRLNREIA